MGSFPERDLALGERLKRGSGGGVWGVGKRGRRKGVSEERWGDVLAALRGFSGEREGGFGLGEDGFAESNGGKGALVSFLGDVQRLG